MKHALILAALASLAAERQAPLGFIHGTVVDLHDAVLVAMRVNVDSTEAHCSTTTSERGEFNCQLPAGQYRVSAEGFAMLPYQRGTVTIRPGVHNFLKLWTVPGPIHILNVDGERFGDPIPIQHYREVLDGGDVVVRYTQSELKAASIKFTGPYLSLTSEFLTVQADEITCTAPIRTCTATGTVRVENDEEELEGTSAEIDLRARTIVVTRPATVTSKF